MNSGTPGLISLASQQPMKQMVGGGMGRVSLGSGNNMMGRRPPSTGGGGGKLMRLRCRFRPLHDAYLKDGVIVEEDSDVIFVCGDGHLIRAHKVILASSSKYFAKLFEDQSNEVTVVSIPDVKVDVMKLILQLTYRDHVILTMQQIKEVGEFITMFGMAWAQFGFEEYSGEEPMSALPMSPVPSQPVELPRRVRLSPTAPHRKIVTEEDGEEDEYNFQVQGYGNGQVQDQMERPTAQHSRKSRLTPRAGTETADDIVEQEEEEDQETLIRDWMSRLGKRDGTENQGAPKRMRGEDSAAVNPPQPKNTCTVCRTAFQTESAWRWHEDRHVGINMFKCQFCDNLSRSPKLCYIHEKEVHGHSGLQQANAPASKSKVDPTGRILIKTNQAGKFMIQQRMVPSEAQKITKRVKMAQLKKMQTQKKKPATLNFANRHPQIGIGDSPGSELLDVKKIKQLHWLYVCERCDNCSDSASKATMHYERCYPEQEKVFADTVTKYRQGFYGKSKCPLCPRRYPQNSGFMIHCGHQHQPYRRLFSHTGSVEDSLKCVGCKEKFLEPLSFHEHLQSTAQGVYHCGESQNEKGVKLKSAPGSAAPAKGTGQQKRQRRAASPVESKASYKVQFHTPPKSARLQSRAIAEAAEAEANAKTKQGTDINFPSVDCPVCGDSDLPNISLHLQSKHKDLNVDVSRISSELLRCKGCTITFNICDLLDHKDCLISAETEKEDPEFLPKKPVLPVEEPSQSQRRLSTGSGKQPAKPAPVADLDTLPPGVGRSPIERIEIDDLNSIRAIRSALKCLVCGKTARKLGVIAECLRAHGVHRCSLCFNSYCSKTDYAMHLKKCHGSGSNKLKCPLCPKAFANAGQTSGHMYSTHWLQMLKEKDAFDLTNGVHEGDDNVDNAEVNSNKDNTEDVESMEQPSQTPTSESDAKTDGVAGDEEQVMDAEEGSEEAADDAEDKLEVAGENDEENQDQEIVEATLDTSENVDPESQKATGKEDDEVDVD